MKKSVILFAVVLLAFSSVSANGISTYSYLPNELEIEYLVFDITGVWSENTYELSITTQAQRPYMISVTPEPYDCPAFSGTKMQWQNPVGTQARSLKNGVMVSSNGLYYLGEGINENDNFIYPYEALLTHAPVAGETIEEVSRVFAGCADNTIIVPEFRWRYKTIAHYDTWGDFSDVWRTGLHEYPNSHVYNYVFARDIGMVDFWHGSVDVNHNVVGVRFYAVMKE